jgi:hypothetical protein
MTHTGKTIMETTSKKTAIRLAVLSVSAMFIASLASSTHPGLANAQQNKTSMQPQGGQNTQVVVRGFTFNIVL